tara:strand:- start:260 stop:505 length:246 start_codon:yes stop_codon:yes gene_type:complete
MVDRVVVVDIKILLVPVETPHQYHLHHKVMMVEIIVLMEVVVEAVQLVLVVTVRHQLHPLQVVMEVLVFKYRQHLEILHQV